MNWIVNPIKFIAFENWILNLNINPFHHSELNWIPNQFLLKKKKKSIPSQIDSVRTRIRPLAY